MFHGPLVGQLPLGRPVGVPKPQTDKALNRPDKRVVDAVWVYLAGSCERLPSQLERVKEVFEDYRRLDTV